MLVLLKNNLNYLKVSISECFLNEYNRLIIMESLSLEKRTYIKI